MACLDDLFGLKEGITGPMGSGKTNEFITRIKRLKRFEVGNGYKVVVAKPEIDTRLLVGEEVPDPSRVIDSRDGLRLSGVIPLASSQDLYPIVEKYNQNQKKPVKRLVLAISEIEFLDSGILDFMKSLDANVYLLWEGLVSSFRGEWFELKDYQATMQDVVRLTDKVESKRSICEQPGCTRYADFTQRLKPNGEPDHWSSELVVVGERQYKAMCEFHHLVPGRDEAKFLLYPVIKAGSAGLPLPVIELIGSYAGIPEAEVASIIHAFEREDKILMKDGRLFPIY
jgi:thymidine kinase